MRRQLRLSPYSGGVFHQMPLVQAVLEPVLGTSPLPAPLRAGLCAVVYIIADLLAAMFLRGLVVRLQPPHVAPVVVVPGKPPALSPLSPDAALAALALNPFTLLACVSRSTTVFFRLFVAASLYFGLHRRPVACGVTLAATAYLNPHAAPLLGVPLGLCCRQHWVQFVAGVGAAAAALAAASSAVHGDLGEAVASSFLWRVSFADCTPHANMFWYLFAEVFGRFRTYFVRVCQAHPYVYLTPLTLRFHRQPGLLFTISFAVMVLTTPFNTVADTTLAAVLMCAHGGPLARLYPHVYFWAIILFGVTVLMPVMGRLWLAAAGGNSNFSFNMSMVSTLAGGILVGAFTAASIRDAREARHAAAIAKNE